ncbi:MAG: DUF4215 domain-containing protein [Sandaracinaceae bacterium]|nr:DUF4215 domain-containing protein [Sandaracinaceae bacterium]
MKRFLSGFGVCVAFVLCACGDDTGGPTAEFDAGIDAMAQADGNVAEDGYTPRDSEVIDGAPMPCGNGVVDTGESCDDANEDDTDACRNTCVFACGDGVVQASETCDTAILSGSGACVSSCDDHDPCTTDMLVGTPCSRSCAHGLITANVAGDACCTDGTSSLEDSDCDTACGNGVLEADELCDPGIVDGPGACPTSCNDAIACTLDRLVTTSRCVVRCEHEEVLDTTPLDGCCPSGATPAMDSDCSPTCGDGSITGSESCDTALPSGAGACPSSCDDMDACTEDLLVSEATCSDACSHTVTREHRAGDSCCSPGATYAIDTDCASICGNSLIEPGEECDDGNRASTDGCDAACAREDVRTIFMFDTMVVRDPHPYLSIGVCVDGTTLINTQVGGALLTDQQPVDGWLDFSVLTSFTPLDPSAASTPVQVGGADCIAPLETTRCSESRGDGLADGIALNMRVGECLAPLAGTTNASYGPIATPVDNCFSTSIPSLIVDLSGITIELHNVQVGAQYSGAPATQLVNGLLMGFLSEADAELSTIPPDVVLLGGTPLASLLPGSSMCCAVTDDRDTLPDGTRGWYFYFNFTAYVVPELS